MLWDFFDLTGVTDAKGSSFKYEYDNHHNVTKGTSAEKRVLYYQYDDKGNVVKSAAVSAGDETAGTWLTRTMTEDQNHVRTVKDARGCQVTYDWDTGEDLLDSVKDARNILWTQGRKLSAISNGSNGKSIRYYYDHTGARVKKTVNGVTTEYRMAGSLLISERTDGTTLWYQYDSAANLVALMIGTERYNYIRNAQNDIIGLIDSTGKRVVSYKYDSWGKVVSITGTLAATVGQKNPFRYRGYYFDAESGMYYLQSRYYDPEIRRFISADNIIVTGTSVEYQNVNLYEYCSDNPINFQDPSGHFILSALAGAGAYFFEAIVSLGASYLLTKEIAGVVDEFAWYRKSQKEKRDEALLSRVITRDLLKQDYDYWTAELKKINGKKQVVGGEPLTVEEACLRVSQLKSVICRNEAAAKYIIFVNGYVNAIGPEKHGEDFFSHYHPTRNHTGYSSVHIWFFE